MHVESKKSALSMLSDGGILESSSVSSPDFMARIKANMSRNNPGLLSTRD
jgi:hypothetical protein